MRHFLLSVLLLATFNLLSAQTIHYVNVNNTTPGDGLSWGTAFTDLQQGIDGAAAGDTVWVAAGTYAPTGTSFVMKNGVVVLGGFNGTETDAAMRNWNTNVTALTNNNSSNAAIINNNIDSTAILDGFQFNSITNYNYDIAGIYNIASSPTIKNCQFSNNYVMYGSQGTDMDNENGSSPKISNCVFQYAQGEIGFGPSVLNDASSAVFTNCVFNSIGGGAILNQNSAVTTVVNCVFANGLYIQNQNSSSFIAVNSTFNTTSISSHASSSYTITNCVFWNNNQQDLYTDSIGSVTYSYSQSAIPGIGNVQGTVDPFVNDSNPIGNDGTWMTADDGLAVYPLSAVADKGTPDTSGLGLPATDITGARRIQGAGISFGAYEAASKHRVYVNQNNSTGIYTGASWDSAFNNLYPPMNLTSAGDTIWVAAGTYAPPTNSSFVMRNGVVILGGFNGTETNATMRNWNTNITALTNDNYSNDATIVNNNIDSTAVLDGVQFSQILGNDIAGISNISSSPTIRNCVFSSNYSEMGSQGTDMDNENGSSPK